MVLNTCQYEMRLKSRMVRWWTWSVVVFPTWILLGLFLGKMNYVAISLQLTKVDVFLYKITMTYPNVEHFQLYHHIMPQQTRTKYAIGVENFEGLTGCLIQVGKYNLPEHVQTGSSYTATEQSAMKFAAAFSSSATTLLVFSFTNRTKNHINILLKFQHQFQ